MKDNLADGTTAVIALIVGDSLFIGNVGDSEAVLARGRKAEVLSVPHNVRTNKNEKERIKKAGGIVYNERLGHPNLNPAYFSIAVSRAIGDVMFKHEFYTDKKPSGLIAEPDIRKIVLQPEDQFLILACDGLWDVIKYQDAVDLVGKYLVDIEDNPQKVSEELVKYAYLQGSTDNITAMVIVFSHHAPAKVEEPEPVNATDKKARPVTTIW